MGRSLKLAIIIIIIILIAFLTIYMGREFLSKIDIILSVETDKDSYKVGELVEIKVSLKEAKIIFKGTPIATILEGKPLNGRDIAIQLLDPDGVTLYVDQGKTNKNGETVFRVRISNTWKPGTYTIHAVTPGKHTVKTFKIEKP